MRMEKVKFKIKDCPRCHKNHNAQIKVKQFVVPMKFKGGDVVTWWALCPTTKDPIIFKDTRKHWSKWSIPLDEIMLSIEWNYTDNLNQSDDDESND